LREIHPRAAYTGVASKNADGTTGKVDIKVMFTAKS
jgi:hypothetical protein